MTTTQFDNACYKAHNLLDTQGCVCIKVTMDYIYFDKFHDECMDLRPNRDYEYSYMGKNTVYLYFLILNRIKDFDKHEYAGFIMSELAFNYKAKKIESL